MESGNARGLTVSRVDAAEVVQPYKLAACVDCETTGLDPHSHELIELAIILFAYEPDSGRIIGIIDEYVGQREPYRSIPRDATQIHGLTKAKLKGKVLDTARIESMAARATCYISHNASFDKGFAGRYLPPKRWLCSLNGIDWAAHGCERRGLQALLTRHCITPASAHRAGSDAEALLDLLAFTNSIGVTYLQELLAGRRSAAASSAWRRSEPKIDAEVAAAYDGYDGSRRTRSPLEPWAVPGCFGAAVKWALIILGVIAALSLIVSK